MSAIKTPGAHRVLVVGATSQIAQECMQLWAAGGATEFVLLGRNLERLQAVADDLQSRNSGVGALALESGSTPEQIAQVVDEAWGAGVDTALIAQGSLPDQALLEGNPLEVQREFGVNATVPILFVESIATKMLEQGSGRLAVIGSVAGDRGRASNYVYGAAKAALGTYTEGLWQRLAGSGVSVTLVKPGPTATPMTQHLVDEGQRLASAESVAAAIVRGVERRVPVVYAPAKWRLIMSIVRAIPRPIFKRLSF